MIEIYMGWYRIGKDDKLNVLTPDFGSSRLELKQIAKRCNHSRIVVDPTMRQVECKDCGAIIDPIHALVQFAEKERRFQYSREEVLRAQERVKDLKVEEKKIKSRIKYAKARIDDGGSEREGIKRC